MVVTKFPKIVTEATRVFQLFYGGSGPEIPPGPEIFPAEILTKIFFFFVKNRGIGVWFIKNGKISSKNFVTKKMTNFKIVLHAGTLFFGFSTGGRRQIFPPKKKKFPEKNDQILMIFLPQNQFAPIVFVDENFVIFCHPDFFKKKNFHFFVKKMVFFLTLVLVEKCTFLPTKCQKLALFLGRFFRKKIGKYQ